MMTGFASAKNRAYASILLGSFVFLFVVEFKSLFGMNAFLPIEATPPTTSDVATTSNQTITASKYAYAFVIGGCNPDEPSYRGYVYDILISAQILKDQGSTADIVAFFQLSFAYKGGTELPAQDVQPLTALGVHIYYIPPSEMESFYDTNMNKFRILNLTQYRRVLFLDGDVMPIGNLDYIFELSDDDKYGPGNSTLKQNFVVAARLSPANGGFFMLTPGKGEYEHIQEIIHTREVKAKNSSSNVKFDVVEGWGHIITEPDEWVVRGSSGRNWTFFGAFVDQGLLYYWVKYIKKDVSIVFSRHVENLSADQQGNVISERILNQPSQHSLKGPFQNFSKPLLHSQSACVKFMCDFVHFTGKSKPWMSPPPAGIVNMTEPKNPKELWWYTLKNLNEHEKLKMGLDFDNWDDIGRPSLGLFAKQGELNKRLEQLADKNESLS